ncbi:MAG: 5'-deoxynucleotidase [Clostridiales bacterium]|nr:5'-deoxynucleotidase [Clostridiales bacterium]
MSSSFYALVFRQKYIKRWGLMRSVEQETLSDHVNDVAVLTHALATIGNTFFDKHYDAEKAVVYALFHDLPEVFTGDLPTPIKYFNDSTKKNYKQVESQAIHMLLSKLPEELKPAYDEILHYEETEKELHHIIKCADKLAALIKCMIEERSGNLEFTNAKAATLRSLSALSCPELDYFMENFLPAFDMTLDEMNEQNI